MNYRETPLAGAFVIELAPHRDERGFFARALCCSELAERGLHIDWPQCNLSRNAAAGTLRGLHYNAAPHREAKVVRCVAGAVWDVIVDLRAGSATHLRWFGIELSAEGGTAVYIPEGFAHGFVTLRDGSDVFYHMGREYVPAAARGLRWDDPRLAIDWPLVPRAMSERDRTYPDFDAATFDG